MKEQEKFIALLKKIAPANINLANEIVSVLDLSLDAVYRRLRNETSLSLDETVALCNHFSIPLESLNEEIPNVVTFKINKLSSNPDSFLAYLQTLRADMQWMLKAEVCSLTYAAEDLPVFYNFYYPALARFKMYYWSKSFLNIPEMQIGTVEDIEVRDEWAETIKENADLFLKIGGVEIWNADTIKSTLQQVLFYWDAGFFRSRDSAFEVISDLENMMLQIKQQADTGKKMDIRKGQFSEANYNLYLSDLMIGNNTVLIEADEKRATYIGYNSFNFMRTSNNFFNEQTSNWAENLIAKSTLVSKVAEKQRNQFFKNKIDQIQQLKLYIENN